MAPDFTAKTAGGETFRLSEHLLSGPVALCFHPDYEVPGCFPANRSFGGRLGGLQQKPYSIVGVGYETGDRNETPLPKTDRSYTPILDSDGAIARQYGVAVRDKLDGAGVYLVKGRVYLIGRDGRIESRMDDCQSCKCSPDLAQ
jgi:peroxiredoxin Q/BCP